MSGNQVNWYTLQRMTPLCEPSQKDAWPMLETNRDAALARLASDVGCGLRFCTDDELADFVLVRRTALPASSGTGWPAGEPIETFYVRRG
jgi:hypothetical protein